MKLPFHSENVEEEEYFFFFCKWVMANGKANIRVGKDILMKPPLHSENVEKEEIFFFFSKWRG